MLHDFATGTQARPERLTRAFSLSSLALSQYIACIYRSLDSKRCKKHLLQNETFGTRALETLIAHADEGTALEYTFKIIWRAFFLNKPGSDPDNLKIFDAIFTAKSITKPACIEALRKIWSSVPPVFSKMETVGHLLLCCQRGMSALILTLTSPWYAPSNNR